MLKEKSIVIATYALCGFSNFGSVGVQMAAFSALCPSRIKTFSEIAAMAMVGGTIACFMTACIAGVFKISCLLFFLLIIFLMNLKAYYIKAYNEEQKTF
jgi:hypothetical protein